MRKKSFSIKEFYSKLTRIINRLQYKKDLLHEIKFEVHITDECNLNCVGCSHFAPLAKKNSIYPIDLFQKDINQLGKIFKHKAQTIHILGGEPLLNKNILAYLEITRKAFQEGEIQIITNGILLLSQSEEFWETCRRLGISIGITHYPIKLDYEDIENKIKEKGIKAFAYHYVSNNFRNISLNKSANVNRKKRFYHCWVGNNCINLRHGRLYTCSIPAYADIYNAFFGDEFNIGPKNSIDIYSSSRNKILDFLRTSIPFCSYCNYEQKQLEWKVSKKEKKEWTVSNS